ncbi:hypothetical protein GCM10010172_57900 [Paractinoplanes ferrugineus]|uniref:Uncharacterized protein n=1 Tax=Paractinoplanes ferrugineus TaxID=113564 RepID=A0A919JEW1_9ACTN|nr:hypothetical protein Afe05nite_77460 [Actinoplanes ferrugineus]
MDCAEAPASIASEPGTDPSAGFLAGVAAPTSRPAAAGAVDQGRPLGPEEVTHFASLSGWAPGAR